MLGVRPHFSAQLGDRYVVSSVAPVGELAFHPAILRVGCPGISSGVFGNENVLHKRVQLVQINVGEQG